MNRRGLLAFAGASLLAPIVGRTQPLSFRTLPGVEVFDCSVVKEPIVEVGKLFHAEVGRFEGIRFVVSPYVENAATKPSDAEQVFVSGCPTSSERPMFLVVPADESQWMFEQLRGPVKLE